MTRNLIIATCLMLSAPAISAQHETPDTIGTPRIELPTQPTAVSPTLESRFDSIATTSTDRDTHYQRLFPEGSLPQINPSAYTYHYYPYIPGGAPIHTWDTGSIYASAGTFNAPGMLGVESGTVNLQQNFGALTLHAYGGATKYGYFRGLDTSWSFGGDATIRISDNLSFTAFGTYAIGINPIHPAINGYSTMPLFGAFLDYHPHKTWGVQAGFKTERSMLTGRWETRPTLTPYVSLNGTKLGIDVGSILYELLTPRTHNWGPQNPTIAPPVQKLSDTFH